MAVFRAPQQLFDRFDGATEDEKQRIRADVVAWMRTLSATDGDTVIAPHPETGVEQSFTRQLGHN